MTKNNPPEPKEFLFDLKLFASVRVRATNESAARSMIANAFNCADANFGAWPNGDPILGEASLDDCGPDLIEIDGEAV